MVFRPDDDEKEAFHELRRKNAVKSARQLMNMTYEDYVKGNRAELHMDEQFVNLLRFIEGPGRRRKLFKGQDFILEYMRESIVAAVRYKEENPTDAEPEAGSEEEEEAQAQKRGEVAAKRRSAILRMVNDKLCSWSDKEWKRLNKAYAKFCK